MPQYNYYHHSSFTLLPQPQKISNYIFSIMADDNTHMNSDKFPRPRDHIQWGDDTSKSYALSGKIMLIAIVVLFAVVLFMVALHIYARWYLLRGRRRHRRNRRQRPNHIVFYNSNSSYTAGPYTSGLDSSVIAALPIFKYSSQTHACALECAVCLSEFEDDENGRLLPKCQHCFHTDCIDMWFQSHSTCPICRSPVDPAVLVTSNQNEAAISVDVVDSDSGPGVLSNNSEQSGCTTCLTDRMKKDLVLVGVEKEDEESSINSPACRTPGTRMLSLKRILSMNRKLVPAVAVSPSSDIGTSSRNNDPVAESDIEQGTNDSTRIQTRAQSPR